MTKGTKTLLWIAGLLALAIVATEVASTWKPDQAEPGGYLVTFTLPEVERVKLTRGSEQLEFERDGQRWKMVQPSALPADGGAVTALLQKVLFTQVLEVYPYDGLGADKIGRLREWGLDPGDMRLEVYLANRATPQVVAFGRPFSDESLFARHVTNPRAPAVRVSKLAVEELRRPADDFRGQFVFLAERKEVVGASVKKFAEDGMGGSRETRVEIDPQHGSWSLTKPLQARVDRVEMDQWIDAVLGLRVARYAADNPRSLSEYGLATPTWQITLDLLDEEEDVRLSKADRKLSLVVGKRAEGEGGVAPRRPGDASPSSDGEPTPPGEEVDGYFVKRLDSPAVFTVPADALDRVLNSLEGVRERRILPINTKYVSRVVYERGGARFDLQRDAIGRWHFAAEPEHGEKKPEEANPATEVELSDEAVNQARAQSLLNRLSQARALGFEQDSGGDLTEFGLDEPDATVTIYPRKEVSTDAVTIKLAVGRERKLFAKTSLEPFVYEVNPILLLDIPQDAFEWRPLQVVSVPLAEITAVEIARKEQPTVQLTLDEATRTFQAADESFAVDQASLRTQLALLCQLRATMWLSRDGAAYGLDKPERVFTLSRQDGSEVRISLGAETKALGRAARLNDEEVVFEIDHSDYSLLTLDVVVARQAVDDAPAASPQSPVPSLEKRLDQQSHDEKGANPSSE